MHAGRALSVFSLSLVALTGGAEALVRWQEDAFSAASHRARFKAELLRKQESLDFVAIGTSRFNDGVNPGWFEHGRGFNASVPSSSVAAQAHLAGAALAHPGIKALFVEASPRQVQQVADATLAAGPEDEPRDFEARALSASRLLRHRRVLMVENLPRLIALWAPISLDGSEWFRTRWLLETWRAKPTGVPPLPAPLVRCPGPAEDVDPAHEVAVVAWAELARSARAHGVSPFFVVPPVASGRRSGECTPAWAVLWQAAATRTGAPVYDFGCSPVPDSLFHDGAEHFSVEGRAAFTDALGTLWRKAEHAPPCGGDAR